MYFNYLNFSVVKFLSEITKCKIYSYLLTFCHRLLDPGDKDQDNANLFKL